MKVRKNFRMDEDIVHKMDALVNQLSKELHVKLNHTTLIELLVSERYEKVLKYSEEVPNGYIQEA